MSRPAPRSSTPRESSSRSEGVRAVNGATLDVREGSITALIGPNGAGKTTLFNVLTGFYRGDAGQVSFAGNQIIRRPPYAIARLGMVRTFQITKALSRMPVIDNMMLAAPDQPGERLRQCRVPRRLDPAPGGGSSRTGARVAQLFNLQDKADEYAGTLSGGSASCSSWRER